MPKTSKKKPDFHVPWEIWLKAIITSLNQATSSKLDPGEPAHDRIHLLRASLKNTRALLRLAPAGYRQKARRLRRDLSLVSDSLAADRDQKVLSETLQSLEVFSPNFTGSELVAATSRFENARKEINRILDKIMMIFEVRRSVINLKKYAQKERNKERSRRPKSIQIATSDELHRWRSALISRLLQSKFFHSTIGYPKSRKIEKLERLRNLLGEFNDLQRAIASLRSSRHKRATIERAQERQKNLKISIYNCLKDKK